MTIGDGLVSQIPALIISIAAGMVVSKAGVEGSADKALTTQLAMNPVGLGMVSASSGVIALIPGMPIIPFAALALGAGALAYKRVQDAKKPQPIDPAALEAAAPAEAEEEPISASLAIDDVKIELDTNGPICTVAHDKQQGRGRAAHLLPYWFRPSQYWGHGGPLIQEFKISLNHNRDPLRQAMQSLLFRLTEDVSVSIPDNFLNL